MNKEYPDNNGNGVPDALEQRKPLSEVLGFDERERPAVATPVWSAATTAAPMTSATYPVTTRTRRIYALISALKRTPATS